MTGVVLRAAVEGDIPSINAIYRYYVTNSTCVWTTDLPTNQDRLHWFRTCSVPTPVLVAELDGSEGFEMRGRHVNVGFKFQRWHDAVYMQLPLARNMTGIETKK